LKEVKKRTLEAFENQEYQFEDLVEQAAINRDAGRNPLFDVLFSLQRIGPGESPEKMPGYGANQYLYENTTSKFDMTLTVSESPENLVSRLTYSTALFKKETIERFTGYFKNIVSTVTTRKDIKLSQIEIMSAGERKYVLYDLNKTGSAYPVDKTIHQLFEEQVEKTPDQLSVEFRNEQLTYRQLNSFANKLARILRAKGVTPDSIVGLMLDRSIGMIPGIMSILKADGAYMPIDPQYPPDRTRYMLADSSVEDLVTSRSLSKEVEKLKSWQGEILHITPFGYSSQEGIPATCGLPPSTSTRTRTHYLQPATCLAYIIYTSGTTGNPKAVMIEHKNVINLVMGLREKVYNFNFNV
ncbi:MAG: AMP-binding protein, partial [bacterium]|nr:AMP-binding protein [bacterium]